VNLEQECYWIIDDTGIPKQITRSVTRQYCGQLGKTENCQVAVSLLPASDTGSVPIQWQLYLPEDWTEDRPPLYGSRCANDIIFATREAHFAPSSPLASINNFSVVRAAVRLIVTCDTVKFSSEVSIGSRAIQFLQPA